MHLQAKPILSLVFSLVFVIRDCEGANVEKQSVPLLNQPLPQVEPILNAVTTPSLPVSVPLNAVTLPQILNVTTGLPLSPLSTTTRRPGLQGLKLPCTCSETKCGCCSGMILERFKQKACMNFTYDPDDFAITAVLSMNGRVLYKDTFSGKNPDPMCIRVPRFRFIEFCVEFSNIYLARRNLHMCIDAEASWEDFTLVEWSFDCIRLGANGVALISPEEGGGIPLPSIDGEDQTDEDYDDSARNAIPLKDSKFTVERLPNNEVLIKFHNNGKFTGRRNVTQSATIIPPTV